ncbi:MAG: NYN domain-containing protein [Lachnospiraceae bacterium]|nr:NYN domain-containing protein [Lachnospiraceae bacterium]
MAKKPVVGILAHVDAGKTTLSEGMLYESGMIRSLGRVDHKDAYLDTFRLEQERGITIFSKLARVSFRDMEMTLLDTPGHVDFSAETERTLQVLDYAILVISATDGVQAHTRTLWELLTEYGIPTFIFINKMDLALQELTAASLEKAFFTSPKSLADKERAYVTSVQDKIVKELQKELSEGCIPFPTEKGMGIVTRREFAESAAMTDEAAMEEFLEHETLTGETVRSLIVERKVFPVYFGAALSLYGVEEFLKGLSTYTSDMTYPEDFGARVYKIARDEKGNRLTYLKVTGGVLKVKGLLSEEKVEQIRLYSGNKFEAAGEIHAGGICAVTGPVTTFPGQGIGIEEDGSEPVLSPVMTYQMVLADDNAIDMMQLYERCKELAEEDPTLNITWNDALSEIHVQVMGKIQLEILKDSIEERFGAKVEFQAGRIVYKETVKDTVVGIGHFEPLRHYAEVQLRLEPLPRGSGVIFDSEVSTDVLDLNWQRLIMTHVMERRHPGVLTGSPLTDVRVTLLAGAASVKHTVGGDFRQATYRAIRQGLMQAMTNGNAVLLEPYYSFSLSVPTQMVGRAMTDIQNMAGRFDTPLTQGDETVLTGRVPVSTALDYMAEVSGYTGGKGRLQLKADGYDVCHDQEEAVAKVGYDVLRDERHPTGSVFCQNGAGVYVPWDEVERMKHTDYEKLGEEASEEAMLAGAMNRAKGYRAPSGNMDKELEAIMEREFGAALRKRHAASHARYVNQSGRGDTGGKKIKDSGENYRSYMEKNPQAPVKYLLVDGYNIIFAKHKGVGLSDAKDLDFARNELMDRLCDYQGYTGEEVILVFDAYKVKGHKEEVCEYHNIHLVYTAEAETADAYIEKTSKKLVGANSKGARNHVRVATSDGLEQMIILGNGAIRVSAPEFLKELDDVREKNREKYHL